MKTYIKCDSCGKTGELKIIEDVRAGTFTRPPKKWLEFILNRDLDFQYDGTIKMMLCDDCTKKYGMWELIKKWQESTGATEFIIED